jgi:hypothetical protein
VAKTCLRISALAVALIAALGMGLGRAGETSPEEIVRGYLSALQKHQFDKAYDLVSKAMKTDRKSGRVKPKDVWVRESQYLFAFSDAKIFSFTVLPGRLEDGKAVVPNILSSRDNFVNQLGLKEYELYTLVKEDGGWKVDQQEEVVEPADIAKWFAGKG